MLKVSGVASSGVTENGGITKHGIGQYVVLWSVEWVVMCGCGLRVSPLSAAL